MTISGARHIALSVTEIDRSARWYTDVLGFHEIFRETNDDRSAVIMRGPDADVLIGLVQFANSGGDAFTAYRTGLDHLCFLVPERSDLEKWAARLDDHGVAHSGIVEMATDPILNFKDPDCIAPRPRHPGSCSSITHPWSSTQLRHLHEGFYNQVVLLPDGHNPVIRAMSSKPKTPSPFEYLVVVA